MEILDSKGHKVASHIKALQLPSLFWHVQHGFNQLTDSVFHVTVTGSQYHWFKWGISWQRVPMPRNAATAISWFINDILSSKEIDAIRFRIIFLLGGLPKAFRVTSSYRDSWVEDWCHYAIYFADCGMSWMYYLIINGLTPRARCRELFWTMRVMPCLYIVI